MLGCQYKYMDRFYVMVGETFRGIVHEPLFVETTKDGRPLSRRPERLDGWYLGVATGLRWRVGSPRKAGPLLAVLLMTLATALVIQAL
jgi:hypothetical protein